MTYIYIIIMTMTMTICTKPVRRRTKIISISPGVTFIGTNDMKYT